MVYNAPGASDFRQKGGTLAEKITDELALIDTELDTLTTANGKAAINIVDLTANIGTTSALATSGVDLADGSGGTTYAVWVAPVACTITGVITSLTEAYVKDTSDAKIEIVDNAASPVTKFTYTLPEAGRAAKNLVVHTTIASAALAAGDILNLKITSTGSSSGTGHAKVFLRYTIN
jgi:hypothetical protein